MRLYLRRCSLPAMTVAAVWLLATLVFTTISYGGGRPSESILPASTKGFLSSPNPAALREAWERTQLGQLVRDPEMQPFVESFRDQLKNKLTETGKKLGVAWTDLEGVAGGEIALAAVANQQGRPANVLIVDVTGNQDRAAKLLAKVSDSLTSQGAKRSQQTVGGETAAVYELQRDDAERRIRRAYHVVKDDLLIACDDPQVLGDMLGRWNGGAKDALEADDAFVRVMTMAAHESKGLAPHVRWFIEPFGLVEMIRAAEVTTAQRKRDIFKALKNQGYTAIKGIGGHVNFSAGGYELLHRTAIYAPAPATGERLTLAARALEFPNGNGHQPPSWVPREIASFASINVAPAKAFAASKSLINELANDPRTEHSPGFIDDILEGIKTDRDGPQVDIEGEIFANLGEHAVVITDYEYPVTPQCERTLLAVETTDAEAVSKALDRLMLADSTAKQLTIGGVKVWMMTEPPPVEEEVLAPAVVVAGGDGFIIGAGDDEVKPAEDKPVGERFRAPNSAWAVAHGHLFHASHVELLRKVLEPSADPKTLSDAADHQTVLAEMEKLGAGENSFRFFARTDEQTRPTYELIRAGKMPLAETLLGRILNRLFEEPRSLEPRPQKIDGSKLPSYDMVRRYLGPAGTFVTTRDDGWFVTGFSLPKRAPLEIGQAP